jgi:hypothetical protein
VPRDSASLTRLYRCYDIRSARTWQCAPARAIQDLAGHQDLGTTQQHMHLSPAAIESAIRLLDGAAGRPDFGDILETRDTEIVKSSR